MDRTQLDSTGFPRGLQVFGTFLCKATGTLNQEAESFIALVWITSPVLSVDFRRQDITVGSLQRPYTENCKLFPFL